MADADYIVVGSGAGGGPLAANLARAGYSVLLIEAGGDLLAEASTADDKLMYEVPAFHGLCTEHRSAKWDFFVHHYADKAQEKRDSKYVPEKGGVWYPRAGTLGGCTGHNAMITVTPQAIDWDTIARATGDWSWRAEAMYPYFARLEACGYEPRPGSPLFILRGLLWSALALIRRNPDWRDWRHGHGFDGWLHTSEADPLLLLKDQVLTKLVLSALQTVTKWRIGNLFGRAISKFDPNDRRNSEDSPEGVAFTPLAVRGGKRNGPREFIKAVEADAGSKLKVRLHTLVTRVVFDKANRATGVEVLEGEHLYGADPDADPGAPRPKPKVLTAGREVILSAGAFNTPQLLKLSGIGPRAELEGLGIPVVADLPGVGENLQDRYEIGVISDFPHKFELLAGATFAPPVAGKDDPVFDEWKTGKGLYTSNGALVGVMKRSRPHLSEPDLYIFGLPGFFKGYHPGYSAEISQYGNKFTWAVLKAYTDNAGGRVTLQSNDPTRPPRIDFHYFKEGTDESGQDLEAVAAGVDFVRAMNKELGACNEQIPGPNYATPEATRQFIRDEAWGHHASCTAKIGPPSNPLAVLDSRFRVRGVTGLRVVDACVFPRIPGYFIVSAVYMISEKAFDVIREDHDKPLVTPPVPIGVGGYRPPASTPPGPAPAPRSRARSPGRRAAAGSAPAA